MIDTISLLLTKNENILVIILQIILIVALALIATKAVSVLMRRVEARFTRAEIDEQRRARIKTFLTTGIYVINIVILFIAVLMLLMVLGIDITPLLASVGVVSLAISLGAQTIIKDYISGILILVEDQFRVGDSVQFDEFLGVVENITLRSTYLRDLEGKLIIVPNGEIRILTRPGYDWMRAVVEFNVPYDADIGKVVGVLESAMEQASQDPDVGKNILENPQVQGWTSFSPWSVQVRVTAKVVPAQKLVVTYALRKYGLDALMVAGLQIATSVPMSTSES
jgi:moderate conductance mechanosensitive channel